jgi:hypothetical protein
MLELQTSQHLKRFYFPHKNSISEVLHSSGSPATLSAFGLRSAALRPTLSRGLPFSNGDCFELSYRHRSVETLAPTGHVYGNFLAKRKRMPTLVTYEQIEARGTFLTSDFLPRLVTPHVKKLVIIPENEITGMEWASWELVMQFFWSSARQRIRPG